MNLLGLALLLAGDPLLDDNYRKFEADSGLVPVP
jgi:hypothetical protein